MTGRQEREWHLNREICEIETGMGRVYSPPEVLGRFTYGVAIGWYGVAPLALGDMRAIEGHRPGAIPAWGNALGIRSDIFPRAEGPRHSNFPVMRPIASGTWGGPLALEGILGALPGALPQAGMASRRWR